MVLHNEDHFIYGYDNLDWPVAGGLMYKGRDEDLAICARGSRDAAKPPRTVIKSTRAEKDG